MGADLGRRNLTSRVAGCQPMARGARPPRPRRGDSSAPPPLPKRATKSFRREEPVQGRHPSRPSVCSAAALALAATLLAARPAHAYVDPGTGSFVLQLLLAAFFGVAFTFRRAW